MTPAISNRPDEGKRVWCVNEIGSVSPQTKLRIRVAENTGGTIDHIHSTGPLGTGKALVVIRWDTSLETDTDFSNIVCIHPFQTMQELLDAAQEASQAEIFYDAKGDFQEIRIEVPLANEPWVTLAFGQDEHPLFRHFIMPRLKLGGVRITETWAERLQG